MDTPITQTVQDKIYHLRDVKVMIDSDIAKLYGVETKRINEAVKNNPEKFPDDFMFELTDEEFSHLRSKISTAKFAMTRTIPKAFTEQGVYMLATVLKSQRATAVTIIMLEDSLNALEEMVSEIKSAKEIERIGLFERKRKSFLKMLRRAELYEEAITSYYSPTNLTRFG